MWFQALTPRPYDAVREEHRRTVFQGTVHRLQRRAWRSFFFAFFGRLFYVANSFALRAPVGSPDGQIFGTTSAEVPKCMSHIASLRKPPHDGSHEHSPRALVCASEWNNYSVPGLHLRCQVTATRASDMGSRRYSRSGSGRSFRIHLIR